ncbi:MAG: 50S ribosomal protein L31 [Rickettsiales bacterium]|nr:MAG: 50S ribosomal protein L31 [Rickettsiales bacterium]
MKKDIHPAYKELTISIGKDKFVTASTLKSGEILMDVDFRKHPAWNKDGAHSVNQSNKTVSDFNKKFGGLSFGMKK